MTVTQEVTSVAAFTDTLGADGQKQAMQRKMRISQLHSNKVRQSDASACCVKGQVVRWQAGWILKGWNAARLFLGCEAYGARRGVQPMREASKAWESAWLEVGGQGEDDTLSTSSREVADKPRGSCMGSNLISNYKTKNDHLHLSKTKWTSGPFSSLCLKPRSPNFWQSYENLTWSNKLTGLLRRRVITATVLLPHPLPLTASSPSTSWQPFFPQALLGSLTPPAEPRWAHDWAGPIRNGRHAASGMARWPRMVHPEGRPGRGWELLGRQSRFSKVAERTECKASTAGLLQWKTAAQGRLT